METLIFSTRLVMGTIPYAQFCPIPSPFLLIFSKNDFEVKEVLEKQQKNQNYIYEKMEIWLSTKGGSHNPSRTENQC